MSHLDRGLCFSLLAGLLLAAAPLTAIRAADGAAAATAEKVFTQVPVIAEAQTRGSAPKATSKPELPKPAKDGAVPQWIWGADQNRVYYLKTEFDGGSKAALLQSSCDNGATIWLNGKEALKVNDWQAPSQADVQNLIKPGKNVLVAEVRNEGGPAAFILNLSLTLPDGTSKVIVSDASWLAAENKELKNAVAVRVIGKLGIAPYGNVFDKSAAVAGAARDLFNVLPGFQVERLFTVPKDTLGSWVSITVDHKGRLIVSDQGDKGLCRITPPASGSQEPTRVERLDVKISGAHGMLYAFDSLYLSVNGGPGGSGLYRAKDTNGDDQYDEVVKLAPFAGGGEHGPHALRLSPDGKSIYVVAGNHTDPPAKLDASRIPSNWQEDHLLPRQWDANGHAVGKLAPGGWIAKTDPDGKTWEIISMGYRNAYDMDFNADGELFAYDSDMEWDMAMPWYRPTRVTHAVSGSEFGWRSGTGKWPAYYIDSLPPLLDVGPGSPVGVGFGYGTKFPAKYQRALYICDWTFGTMYALHLEPAGATYRAVKEEFVSRTPLPLTDVTPAPDGALYFTIGGRGAQSELFRITYVGKESTAPADLRNPKFADLRALRQQLESYHRPLATDAAKAIDFAWPHLKHTDRFIQYAARIAIEQQDAKLWQDRVLNEADPETLLVGAVALARQGDKGLQPQLLHALERLDFAKLTERQQLNLLRAWSLVFIRMGAPEEAVAEKLAARLDPFYPAKSDSLNRELCNVLVYLQSPTAAAKTIALLSEPRELSAADMADLLARNPGYGGTIAKIIANQPDPQKLHYAFSLRNLKKGWSLDQRKAYFDFLQDARTKSGGSSYQKFLNNIDRDAFENATEPERLAIEASGARTPYKAPELPKPAGPGKDWTLDELLALSTTHLKGRNFENGKKMFAATRCVICHRFGGDGGATGPDLTQLAGRFTIKDLSEAIVDPSKVVSDQYRSLVIQTQSGKTYTGRIINDAPDAVTMLIDPEDSTKVVQIKKSDIEEQQVSTTSLMPKDLLKTLNQNEVLDLLAYLLSRGNPQDPMFGK